MIQETAFVNEPVIAAGTNQQPSLTTSNESHHSDSVAEERDFNSENNNLDPESQTSEDKINRCK